MTEIDWEAKYHELREKVILVVGSAATLNLSDPGYEFTVREHDFIGLAKLVGIDLAIRRPTPPLPAEPRAESLERKHWWQR